MKQRAVAVMEKRNRWKLATRRSPLALAQTAEAMSILQRAHPGVLVEELPMSTTGDDRLQWSLEVKGGKGLFTSELERAILAGEADFAVHSAKDLPTEMDPGLEIAGYLPREDPCDVLILREGFEVPCRMASGSPRRREQLTELFPEAEWVEIRGNVGTRLDKLAGGYADGGVMAAAGLNRLRIRSFPGLVFQPLSAQQCVPAAGQGAIAVQCRKGESKAWDGLVCPQTTLAVTIERAALSALGGGCHSASAAHWHDGVLYLFDTKLGKFSLPFTESNLETIPMSLAEIIDQLSHA